MRLVEEFIDKIDWFPLDSREWDASSGPPGSSNICLWEIVGRAVNYPEFVQ